jgi:hypothetical protein
MADGEFPSDFPAGCPPTDASDAEGPAFRVVTRPELHPDDFRTYAELGLAPGGDPCRRHGLSVFRSLDEARHQLNLRPYLGSHIAPGELTPAAGKSKLTNPRTGHITWWSCAGVDRPSWFGEPVPCR